MRLRLSAGETVECLVDTGFTGALVLPQDLVTRLNLPIVGREVFEMVGDAASSQAWRWPRSTGWAGGRPSA